MGFLSDLIMYAGAWIEYKLDELTYGLGSNHYPGGNDNTSIDIEKEIADFKTMLNEAAKNCEEDRIKKAMIAFDDLLNSFQAQSFDYELIGKMNEKRAGVKSSLEKEKTITTYVQTHLSENDPDFRALMETAPSKEKEQNIRARIDAIVGEAEREFNKKLKHSVEELNEQLGEHLQNALRDKEKSLKNKRETYLQLLRESENETLQIQRIEEERNQLLIANECIIAVLSDKE